MSERQLMDTRLVSDRRKFLACAGAATLACLSRTAAARTSPEARWFTTPAFDEWMQAQMSAARIPGVALAIIDAGEILRTASYGWADIAEQRPMQTHSLLNIASVTKTITATAVMQLFEQDKLALDEDVNRYLPFPVRNSRHAGTALTIRHLLTHTSSIADGPAYDASYACGDPQVPLGEWLRHYFTVDGRSWDPERNFHPWAPGQGSGYSNVAYGLLGYLVELLSGSSYANYCAQRIFAPLGMRNSRFLIAGMRRDAHATPYTYMSESDESGRAAVPLAERGWTASAGKSGTQVPHCLYSFATPPDGLARTSAIELARFAVAITNRGAIDGQRILAPETVLAMLSERRTQDTVPNASSSLKKLKDSSSPSRAREGVRGWVLRPSTREKSVEQVQGLAWMGRRDLGRETVWYHTGGDPGVSTVVALRLSDRRAVVLLANATDDGKLGEEIVRRAFQQ
jgi:CubicO group peptidase (beta-lactamase class C family)